MEKAVLYARVSSDIQQKERSIDSQIAELKKQITSTGNKLVMEYIDDGYSGALLDRPAMNQLREDLKTDKFQVIYILNTDRIARDVTYQNIIVGEILRYKKQLIINGKDYIHNPENKFTLTVLGAVSELERAKLIERTTRGRQHRLKQGHLMSNGWQTYAYRYIKKSATAFPSYEIIREEADVVKYIFETYANGKIGIQSIAIQLEAMGVPKIKGRNCLNQSQLKAILKNEMYTGIRYFNTMKTVKIGDPMKKQVKRKEYTNRAEWIGIKVPTIISKELYDKVQIKLAYNYSNWRNSKRVQLLSNLVCCGKCDSKCFSYKRPREKFAYKCNNRKIGVHNPEINVKQLESTVWEMIEEIILDPKKLYSSIEILKRRSRTNHGRIEIKIKDIEKQISDLSNQKKRIIDLYASGSLEKDESATRINNYDKSIKKIKSEKIELLKYLPLFEKSDLIQENVRTYCEKVRARFNKCADFETQRQFLMDYISKVTFYRKGKKYSRIRIYGSVPISYINNEDVIPVGFKFEKVLTESKL